MALTAAAVLIPCGAWYLFGTRQLARETHQLDQVARREVTSAAERMAGHVAIRLEELSDHEANRPYVHYWREYESRGETCSDLRVHRSPLALGRKHKLILAHFQIEENGRITSPEPWVTIDAIEFSDPSTGVSMAGPARHLQIHASMLLTPTTPAPERTRPDETAQMMPFRWRTASWEGEATLMAVRQVIAGGETYVQGFVVDGPGLAHWVFERGFPATFVPGEPNGETDVRVPILGAAWHMHVDPRPRMDRVAAQIAELRRQFHQSYFGGLLAALLTGGCLAMLIQRSDRLSEDRSRFAAAAAHELRTPLSGIRLYGEMLSMSLGNPHKVEDYASRITDEAERLTRLIANMFNYNQVEQRRLRVHKEPGDLGRAVRRALAIIQPIVERANAQLVVHIDEPLPQVEFDEDAVHQMVRNLVDNSEKYTRRAIDRRIEVAVKAVDGAVEVSVSDHGPGVPARSRTRIFRPFSRHEKDTETSGLGLGLAVVRTLAVAHGGDVEYQEAPDHGARFVIRFPLDVSSARA